MDMTPEEVRDCAVKVVEEFVNNKTPLSQGVATCAEMHALNPEQIKRTIEAVNSIAYLKLLNGAADRTFEFAVAEYTEVMGLLTLPKHKLVVNTCNPKDQGLPMEDNVNKHDLGMFPKEAEYDKAEMEALLMKAYIRNRGELEKLADRKVEIMLELEDSIGKLKRGSNVLEKLAEVAEESLFYILTPLFGMEKTAAEGLVFLDNDLSEAKRLVDLCKEVVTVTTTEIEKLAFDKRAASILGSITGGAKLGVNKTVGAFATKLPHAAGAAVGGVVGGAIGLAAKGAKTVKKHTGWSGIANTVASVAGASSYKPKNEDVWKALHG